MLGVYTCMHVSMHVYVCALTSIHVYICTYLFIYLARIWCFLKQWEYVWVSGFRHVRAMEHNFGREVGAASMLQMHNEVRIQMFALHGLNQHVRLHRNPVFSPFMKLQVSLSSPLTVLQYLIDYACAITCMVLARRRWLRVQVLIFSGLSDALLCLPRCIQKQKTLPTAR